MEYILLGCVGGLIPDAIRLLKLKDSSDFTVPQYLRQPFFWVLLAIQVAFGAFMVYLFDVKDNVQAVVYGYAGPQIFTSLAAKLISKVTDPPPPVANNVPPVALGNGGNQPAATLSKTKMAGDFY